MYSDKEILMVIACVILSLGFIVIGDPVPCLVLRDDGASLVIIAWVLRGIEKLSFLVRLIFGFRWLHW